MESIPIGVLFSTQGPYANLGLEGYLGAMTAIAEINEAHQLPFELEPVFRDPRGNVEAYAELCREIERDAGFFGHDMRGERAGGGGIIQLHVNPLLSFQSAPSIRQNSRCSTEKAKLFSSALFWLTFLGIVPFVIERSDNMTQKITTFLMFEGKAEEAMNILAFSKRAMARDAQKVLASAIANAENNHNLDVDALVVAEASVGKSMTMKRFHTRGRGKSTRILKPFSRLRIVVREVEEA